MINAPGIQPLPQQIAVLVNSVANSTADQPQPRQSDGNVGVGIRGRYGQEVIDNFAEEQEGQLINHSGICTEYKRRRSV